MSIVALNARNQFKGEITDITLGPVVSEIEVKTRAGIVTSVITTRSVNRLGLAVGDEVIAVTKATEVLLAKL
jgi:molybdopterin-binding protein